MATYLVTGHPLNYADFGDDAALIRAQLTLVGVGQSVTINLPGPTDTKVKGHGSMK